MRDREGKDGKKSRWKKRIKDSIAELRTHVKILERSTQEKLKRKEKYAKWERKYSIKQKGEKAAIEELKQRLQAKSAKLKGYEQWIHRYQLNSLSSKAAWAVSLMGHGAETILALPLTTYC